MVLVFEWKHSTWGLVTGQTTREYRCQSCGAKYTIHAPARLLGLWIAGFMLLPAIFPGLVILYVVRSRSRVEKSIPVSPGAPLPTLRYRDGPPLRSCGQCAKVATAIRITRRTSNGIFTGTEYEYRCDGCSRTFVIESAGGQIFALLMSALVTGAAVAFWIWGNTAGWRYGGTAVCSLIALFLAGQLALRLSNRFRNPEWFFPVERP